MKLVLSIVVMFGALASFAMPIDSRMKEVSIENPTLKGVPFCGDYLNSFMPTFICELQSSKIAIGHKLSESNNSTQCWAVDSGGYASYNLKLRTGEIVISEVKCLQDNGPDIVKPIPPLKPIVPPDQKP